MNAPSSSPGARHSAGVKYSRFHSLSKVGTVGLYCVKLVLYTWVRTSDLDSETEEVVVVVEIVRGSGREVLIFIAVAGAPGGSGIDVVVEDDDGGGGGDSGG